MLPPEYEEDKGTSKKTIGDDYIREQGAAIPEMLFPGTLQKLSRS